MKNTNSSIVRWLASRSMYVGALLFDSPSPLLLQGGGVRPHRFGRRAGTRRRHRHSAPALLLPTLLHCVHKIRENLAFPFFGGAWRGRGRGVTTTHSSSRCKRLFRSSTGQTNHTAEGAWGRGGRDGTRNRVEKAARWRHRRHALYATRKRGNVRVGTLRWCAASGRGITRARATHAGCAPHSVHRQQGVGHMPAA